MPGQADAVAGLDLGLLQPVDVGGDPQLVALGLGGGEDHRLEPDGIGAVELLGPKPRRISSAAWIVGESTFSPAVSSASVTRLVVPVLSLGLGIGPRTVGLLLGLQEANALADGALDLLAGDAARRAGRAQRTSIETPRADRVAERQAARHGRALE